MRSHQMPPDTSRPGRATIALLLGVTLAACGPDATTAPDGRRPFVGPSSREVSTATTTLWDQTPWGSVLISACIGTIPSTADWAADIVVPSGGWTITGVRPISYTMLNGNWDGTLSVYADAAGQPGQQLSSSAVAWVNDDPFTEHTPAPVYVLASPISLSPGKYWLAFEDHVCMELKPAADGDGTEAYTRSGPVWLSHSVTSSIPGDLRFALEGTSQPIADAVVGLDAAVKALGLADGTTTSLGAKTRAALEALNAGNTAAACRALQDFINQTSALAGKKLTSAQAADLIAEATRLRSALGCA